jgi:hypothetical protein
MSETNQFDPTQQAQAGEQLVQRRFGATAQAYARSAVHSQGPDLAWIAEAAALTGKELVVDVATGTGFTALPSHPTRMRSWASISRCLCLKPPNDWLLSAR